MQYTTVTSCIYANTQNTAINCIVAFAGIGVVPFTASASDSEEHGRDIFARAIALEFGAISAYVTPAPIVPSQITRAQGKAVLIQLQMWDAVVSYVAAIVDPTERALAGVALNDTLNWQRNSPFLNAAAVALGLNGAALDAMFVTGNSIEL